MSESYFFAISPKFLKAEHSFAKNVKPNTKYRLAVFKGIQKCDEMVEGFKSKIVNGKIQLQSKELMFNLPYFSPTKNIQFTIKLYEQKPNENEAQIAAYTFGSSDFIKQYKADKQTVFQVNGQLQADLGLQFDLSLEKSKQLLNQVIKKSYQNVPKFTKQAQDDNASRQSKQLVREGEGFLSPKIKIQRKRGHEGRLRSKTKTQEISQTLVSTPRSIPKSTASGKNRNNPPDTNDPIKDQKIYQYQPLTKLKYTDTKQIFDVKFERGSSPVRSSKDAQNAIKSPPQTRASFTSLPQQNKAQNTNQPTNNVLTRTNVASPIQTKNSPLLTSPKNQTATTQVWQIKHSSKVFDIVPKQNPTSQKFQLPKSPEKYEPKRVPKAIEVQSQAPLVNIDKVQQKSLAPGSKESPSFLGGNLPAPSLKTVNQSTNAIIVEEEVSEPKAVKIGDGEDIQVKAKPVIKNDEIYQSGTLRGSMSRMVSSKVQETEVKQTDKSLEGRKYEFFYALFLVGSVFLIYLAMCPTRKV